MAVYCDACKQIDHWIEKSLYSNKHDGYRDRTLTLSTFSKRDPRKVFGKSLWGAIRVFPANTIHWAFRSNYRKTFKVLASLPGSPTTASVCSSCQAFSESSKLSYHSPNMDYTPPHKFELWTDEPGVSFDMLSPSMTYPLSLLFLQPNISGSIDMDYQEIQERATVHRQEIFNKDFINLNLARQWLDTCITRHDSCKIPVPLHLKERLYLIDVNYECIVHLFAPNIEYTALSYVWGNSSVTKATSSNIRDLMKPGALSQGSKTIIPFTIRDAMYLTKSLGKQYIWVDSLCILQDDPQLQGYLDQMAYIYANACVTIIVAEGKNADHGIKGMGQNGDQRQMSDIIIDLPSCSLITCKHNFEKTTWASRGWTFQEGLFSNRAIYVCRGFLSWKCGAGITSELGPLNYGRKSFFRTYIATLGEYEKGMDSFGDLVEDYNKREFTYESDAVKAFSGLSTVISSINKTRIFFGLPLEDFGRYLLWIPLGQLKRRDLCRNTPLGFANVPTWSWLAWKGQLVLYLWRDQPLILSLRIIFEFKLRCGKCSSCILLTDCCTYSGNVSPFPASDLKPLLDLHGWQAILTVRYESGEFLAHHPTNQNKFGLLSFNSQDHAEIFQKARSASLSDHISLYRFFAICEFTPRSELPIELSLTFGHVHGSKIQWDRVVITLCVYSIEGNTHGICERIGIALFPQRVWDGFTKEKVNLLLG